MRNTATHPETGRSAMTERAGHGRFVTFEGIDGSGKTTVAKRVYEQLRREGKGAVLTCEPTATWLGDAVRRSHREEVGPFTETFLFLADRATHNKDIMRWLDEGRVVISDRYCDSTYAYQGAALERYLKNPIIFLKKCGDEIDIKPDITFLLLVPPETSLKRIADRDRMTKFEKLRFLKRVEKNYIELARKEKRFVKLDATMALDDVTDTVLDRLHKKGI